MKHMKDFQRWLHWIILVCMLAGMVPLGGTSHAAAVAPPTVSVQGEEEAVEPERFQMLVPVGPPGVGTPPEQVCHIFEPRTDAQAVFKAELTYNKENGSKRTITEGNASNLNATKPFTVFQEIEQYGLAPLPLVATGYTTKGAFTDPPGQLMISTKLVSSTDLATSPVNIILDNRQGFYETWFFRFDPYQEYVDRYGRFIGSVGVRYFNGLKNYVILSGWSSIAGQKANPIRAVAPSKDHYPHGDYITFYLNSPREGSSVKDSAGRLILCNYDFGEDRIELRTGPSLPEPSLALGDRVDNPPESCADNAYSTDYPVHTRDGNLWLRETDLEDNQPGLPLEWTRTYDSRRNAPDRGTESEPADPFLNHVAGRGWVHNHAAWLDVGDETVVFVSPAGNRVPFDRDGDSFVPPAGRDDLRLYRSGANWVIESCDGPAMQFTGGDLLGVKKLTKISRSDGQALIYGYDSDGRLISIADLA